MTGEKRTKKYLESFRHEVKLMKKMDHPNVIEFYEALEDKQYLYLSMELCKGGELFKKVENGKMSEHRAAKILYELCQGLKHIHDQDIAHCDLKPENFVFKDRGTDSPIKIIDFGMAKPVPPHVYLSVFAGTPYYTAPEILEGKYNSACDMWSMGVITFLMLYGFPPFHSSAHKEGSASTKEILRKVLDGFTPEVRAGYGAWFPRDIKVSAEARDLIAKLLTRDTAKRYTIDEMIAHPWFSKAKGYQEPVDPRVQQSLLEFRRSNKFHQIVLHSLMQHCDREDERILHEAFNSLDADHDGMVSFKELQDKLKGLRAEEIKKIFEDVDENGDGKLSMHELKLAFLQRKVLAKEERLWEAFSRLDLKNTMALTFEEVRDCLMQDRNARHLVTEKEIKEAFDEADVDSDGVVDYDEFLYMMGSKKVPPRVGTLPHRLYKESRRHFSELETKMTARKLNAQQQKKTQKS
uniref:Calcium-dependent protein kinase n=1 Tax=Lotharella oceanica TaxID=641309 RepID=A0A7S2TGQ5_9EUKA